LANGRILFCFPVDYLVWAEANATLALALEQAVSALPDDRGKDVVLAGGISSTARKALEGLGWTVRDRNEKELID
jgi:hypothetical protein